MTLDLQNREPRNPWGLVGYSPDLSPRTLLLAYRSGIFPWPDRSTTSLPWFSPPERGVLEFDRLHVPRSLRTARARTTLRFTFDQACPDVIAACASVFRPGQGGTWILPAIRKAYTEMHRLGHVHSVEAWDGETLAGGLYGVDCGGAFTGESMFHHVPNASKLCLLHLIDHLQSRGLDWIDTQQVTPHMKVLGGRHLSRRRFLERLDETLSRGLTLFP